VFDLIDLSASYLIYKSLKTEKVHQHFLVLWCLFQMFLSCTTSNPNVYSLFLFKVSENIEKVGAKD